MIHVRDKGPFRLIENVHHTAVAVLRIRERREGEVEVTASVGRNAERQDAEERLGPKDEHAVPAQPADAQPLDISEQPQ